MDVTYAKRGGEGQDKRGGEGREEGKDNGRQISASRKPSAQVKRQTPASAVLTKLPLDEIGRGRSVLFIHFVTKWCVAVQTRIVSINRRLTVCYKVEYLNV